jgi:general secretion pathway protein G
MTKGFTLLELLVVISLIGLLTAIAAVNFQSTNQRARDGKRQADLEQMRTALEIARADSADNTYPTNLNNLVTGSYLPSLPADPKSFSYVYAPAADYRTYSLCAHLEKGDTSDSCGGTEACGDACNYVVKNP